MSTYSESEQRKLDQASGEQMDRQQARRDRKVKRITLRVEAVPEGPGWRIETGNTFLNVWVRS
jgi:hypothetical protein